jgi:uncharacterized membrane protein YdjX (TVP38/TMEM64 family)
MSTFSFAERLKKLIGWIWLSLIVLMFVFLAFNPKYLSVSYLSEMIREYEGNIWMVYSAMLLFRCLVMFPSTPLLFLGYVIFPKYIFLVTGMVIISILISATFFYFFAGSMGWHHFFRKKYPVQMNRIEMKLQQPKSIYIVMFWSFLPVFPTDVLCYVAGIVKMPFKIFISGVFLGQLPIMYLYAQLGDYFFDNFFYNN